MGVLGYIDILMVTLTYLAFNIQDSLHALRAMDLIFIYPQLWVWSLFTHSYESDLYLPSVMNVVFI